VYAEVVSVKTKNFSTSNFVNFDPHAKAIDTRQREESSIDHLLQKEVDLEHEINEIRLAKIEPIVMAYQIDLR
jgi:hypothetical protein